MKGICFWKVTAEISQTASVIAPRAGSRLRYSTKDNRLTLDRHLRRTISDKTLLCQSVRSVAAAAAAHHHPLGSSHTEKISHYGSEISQLTAIEQILTAGTPDLRWHIRQGEARHERLQGR